MGADSRCSSGLFLQTAPVSRTSMTGPFGGGRGQMKGFWQEHAKAPVHRNVLPDLVAVRWKQSSRSLGKGLPGSSGHGFSHSKA